VYDLFCAIKCTGVVTARRYVVTKESYTFSINCSELMLCLQLSPNEIKVFADLRYVVTKESNASTPRFLLLWCAKQN
jgi:hypothetical protein